jgi:hypothetical protein
MERQIYDEPKLDLMKKFILFEMNIKKSQTFTTNEFYLKFREKYPFFDKIGIVISLSRLSVNDRDIESYKPKKSDDFLWKVDKHTYRLYDKAKDIIGISSVDKNMEKKLDDELIKKNKSQNNGFVYEKHLRDFLADRNNLSKIEEGLELFVDNYGKNGIEYPVGGKFIDILAKDKNDNFVVIELKVSMGHEKVIGQLLYYINWIKENMALSNQKVRGLIICKEITKNLQYACKNLQDIKLIEYSLLIKFKEKKL